MQETAQGVAVLFYVIDGLVLLVLVQGLYALITGRFVPGLGRLRQLSSPTAIRLYGFSAAPFCLRALWLNQVLEAGLRGQPASPVSGVVFFAGLVVSACLQWWALRLDRRRSEPAPLP